jgi:hypothetical protein
MFATTNDHTWAGIDMKTGERSSIKDLPGRAGELAKRDSARGASKVPEAGHALISGAKP